VIDIGTFSNLVTVKLDPKKTREDGIVEKVAAKSNSSNGTNSNSIGVNILNSLDNCKYWL